MLVKVLFKHLKWSRVCMVLLILYPLLTCCVSLAEQYAIAEVEQLDPLSFSLSSCIGGAFAALCTAGMAGIFYMGYLFRKADQLDADNKPVPKYRVLRIIAAHCTILAGLYGVLVLATEQHRIALCMVGIAILVIGLGRAMAACKNLFFSKNKSIVMRYLS